MRIRLYGKKPLSLDASDWMERAACVKEHDPERWQADYRYQDAKRICKTCPVRAECLEYALAHREQGGVWGGLDPKERKQLKKKRKKEGG